MILGKIFKLAISLERCIISTTGWGDALSLLARFAIMRGMEEHEGDGTDYCDQPKGGAKNQAKAMEGEAIMPQRNLGY